MSDQLIYARDPNVRGDIIMELSMMIASSINIVHDLPGLRVNTNIGQPSFIPSDLPIIQLYFDGEAINPYSVTNRYHDIRTSNLNVYVITNKLGDNPIEDDDVSKAQDLIELTTERINTVIENYNYPGSLIDLVLSARNFSVEPEGTPRIVTGHMIYQGRYHIDLDHPYYRLPYTLPTVPRYSFDD